MPGNWLQMDTGFPDLNGEGSLEEKVRVMGDYLFMLVEQMRYTLLNLDLSNMNKMAVARFESYITDPINAKIKNTEGDVARLTLTADALELQLSDAEDDILQLGMTADALELQLSDAEDDILQLGMTADGLALSISNLDGNFSKISATIDGLTITDADGTTKIKGSSVETGSLNLTGAITFKELDSTVINYMSNTQSLASGANKTVQGWVYSGTTYIDGSKIQTGTVTASHLRGGTISLVNAEAATSGEVALSSATSGNYAVDIRSYAAMRLYATDGDMWLQATGDNTPYLWLRSKEADPIVTCNGMLWPRGNGSYDLGSASYKWRSLYASDGTIQTSDRNAKHDIETLPDKYINMLLWLDTKTFKLNAGTSGRRHVGFIAQDVEEAMALFNVDPLDFGGWCKDVDEAGNTVYMLRYDEFIGILAAAVKKIWMKTMGE